MDVLGGILMSIGDEIRRWRSVKCIAMPQLSASIGTPASTIYLWEKNRLTPNTKEITALAKAFGIPVSDLTGAAAPAQPEKKTEPPREDGAAAVLVPDAEHGSGFDMMLVTRVYHCIRDEAESATLVELATARNLLQESLKIVRSRIKELSDRKKTTASG